MSPVVLRECGSGRQPPAGAGIEQVRPLQVGLQVNGAAGLEGVAVVEHDGQFLALVAARNEGVGASRRVLMTRQAPVDETVVEWLEGSSFTLKIHNGEKQVAPFKSATIQYAIEDAPDGQTRFKGTFAYEMAGGLLGGLLDVCLVRPGLKSRNATLGPNMKVFYETGKVMNPNLQ